MQPRTSDKVSEAVKGKYHTFGFSPDLDDVIALGRGDLREQSSEQKLAAFRNKVVF
jgi:hypothetical protein